MLNVVFKSQGEKNQLMQGYLWKDYIYGSTCRIIELFRKSHFGTNVCLHRLSLMHINILACRERDLTKFP